MTQPAPGPWTYRDQVTPIRRRNAALVLDQGGTAVGAGLGSSDAQALANARLMAAAPELRQALEAIDQLTRRPAWSNGAQLDAIHGIARAAILRHRPETP